MRQVLEDLNLSAQVLEQLLAQPIPVDSLDSHRRMRLLVTSQQTYNRQYHTIMSNDVEQSL